MTRIGVTRMGNAAGWIRSVLKKYFLHYLRVCVTLRDRDVTGRVRAFDTTRYYLPWVLKV